MSDMETWLANNPDITSVQAVAVDLNGMARGKRVPVAHADKLFTDGARMPFSALNVDVGGHDIEDSPLVFDSGDQDGVLRPTERGPLRAPWLTSKTAWLPMSLYKDDGNTFAGDPRHALAAVLDRYAQRGWTPICATELEFYLVDDGGAALRPPTPPGRAHLNPGFEVLSISALEAFDAYFADLYEGCDAMGISAGAATSEGGMGQYEICLNHGPALKTADDTFFFKHLVRGFARAHGFAGSFMAKPYPDHSGTGLHVHFSVVDEDGSNIFDDGTAQGSETFLAAIAGCLAALQDSALIFAPHGASYARLVPEAHAPTSVAWGYENRTAAIRVPGGPPSARRIEHRVAGGDVNPYLLLAVILGAAFDGIEQSRYPPAPISGNVYAEDLPRLPATWDAAIDRFETSDIMKGIFSAELIENLIRTKRQELRVFEALNAEERIRLYLDTV